MKTKREHLRLLRSVQKGIVTQINRVNKEAHIPVWLLRIWGSDIKDAANFMQRELLKKKGKVK